jgi:hypothetical protein
LERGGYFAFISSSSRISRDSEKREEGEGEKRREGPVMSPAHWGTSLRGFAFLSSRFANICGYLF